MKRPRRTSIIENQCKYKRCKFRKRYPIANPTYCIKHKEAAEVILTPMQKVIEENRPFEVTKYHTSEKLERVSFIKRVKQFIWK